MEQNVTMRSMNQKVKDAIIQRYPTEGPSVIAKEFGLSLGSVMSRAYRLGIKSECRFERRSRNSQSVDTGYFELPLGFTSAYMLGYIWADGSVDSELRVLKLRIKEKDGELLGKIRLELKSNHKLALRDHRNGNTGRIHKAWNLDISSAVLVRSLHRLGVVPRKSYRDVEVTRLGKHLRSHFVRGLFDGDGSVGVRKVAHGLRNPKLTIRLYGNHTTVSTVREWIVEEGIKPTEVWPVSKEDRVFGVGCTKQSEVLKLVNWMYSEGTMWLNRKKAVIDIFLREVGA